MIINQLTMVSERIEDLLLNVPTSKDAVPFLTSHKSPTMHVNST